MFDKHDDMVRELFDGGNMLPKINEQKLAALHACMGLSGETGELVDMIKKAIFYDKDVPLQDVMNELGDIEFYLEAIRQNLEIDRDEVLDCNIDKLNKRFPEGKFSAVDAINKADEDEIDFDFEAVVDKLLDEVDDEHDGEFFQRMAAELQYFISSGGFDEDMGGLMDSLGELDDNLEFPKILILGHAGSGKDELAKMAGIRYESSSMAALRIFMFDRLNDLRKLAKAPEYQSMEEAYEDRVNHRSLWYDLICEYNKDDPARLAREIMKDSNCYVGMRSNLEFEACLDEGLFDLVIWIDSLARTEPEHESSFNITFDPEIMNLVDNNGDLDDLAQHAKALSITANTPKNLIGLIMGAVEDEEG